jgi:Holliday junction resolvase-like predicted endonuclease
MQTGLDFTGLKQELGDGYDAFVVRWMELQRLLAGRGRGIVAAGELLTSMQAAYGREMMHKIIASARAPTQAQATALIEAYEWFRDITLTDLQAAVLDSICYRRMRRDMRQRAFKWVEENKSAQEIEDLLDALAPVGPGKPPPPPTTTEDDVRKACARDLEAQGWRVDMEQPTSDGGACDIVARRADELLIVECKVDLTRDSAIFAVGQLDVYSETYRTKNWLIAYWRRETSAEAVTKVLGKRIEFKKVALIAAEAVQ